MAIRVFKYLFFLMMVLSLTNCSSENSETKKEATPKASYACPMNCESPHSAPGVCSVCKMQLVKEFDFESELKPEGVSNQSIFGHSGDWKNQNSKNVSLSEFKGKVIITTMIFTNCDYACPNIIADIQNILDNVDKTSKIQMVLVTMDPENDTPDRLKNYAEKFDLNSDQWTFLTGSKDDIYTYSQMLGLKYKRFENGAYGHSNILSLTNSRGEIVYQLEGIHADREKMLNVLKTLI